jgi:hypothetical protein
MMTAGIAVAALGCSSNPPRTQGNPVSLASTPVTAATSPPTATLPPAATGTSGTSAASACSFVVAGATSCASTNPRVKLYVNFADDTSSCVFVRNITWGDGTSSNNVVVYGGPAGPHYADSHTYKAPGTYTIYFGGQVTQGSCIIRTPTFTFRLLPA